MRFPAEAPFYPGDIKGDVVYLVGSLLAVDGLDVASQRFSYLVEYLLVGPDYLEK